MNTRTDDEYKREVLDPARAAGDQPPADLAVRYALTEPLVAAEVTARVTWVRQVWRRSRGQLKYRKLIDRLEAEHRRLAPLFEAAERGDLKPLRERLHSGQRRDADRRAQARARLVDAAGVLRLLAPADLEQIARAGGVTVDELRAAVAGDDIEVREPGRLPVTPPYAGYRRVREALDVLGYSQLAEFLFGGPTPRPMRVLDGFAAPGAELSAARITAVADAWGRRARDTSTTHADTVLAALRGAPPDELIRHDVTDRLRERHRQRASVPALLRYAADELGVDRDEARLLVFAVTRESDPGGGSTGRLRALLDAGEVYAAALLADAELESRPGKESDPDVEVLVQEARRRVETAVRLRERAVAEQDPDRAWRLLADARRLVPDLPGAEQHQDRLAPKPVPYATATVDTGAEAGADREAADGGASVRLAWTPSPSRVGAVNYVVVRRTGRPPQDAGDGVRLPVRSSGDALSGARDGEPPVNVPLYYGVIALRGSAAAVPAVAGPVTIRPDPGQVRLTAGDGEVTGRWHCPAEAARVVVTRAGRAVPAGRDGFRERVPNGVTHHYRISAVYLDRDGGEAATSGVLVSVTPSAPPEPVTRLTAQPDPVDPGRLLLRFDPPASGTADVVRLDGPVPWTTGSVVPLARLRRTSTPVPCSPTGQGLAVRPGASGTLLLVTVTADSAAIGAAHRHIDLPPIPGLSVERRAGAVLVAFDWPDGVTQVRLICRVGSAAAERRTVTRTGYQAGGGVQIPAPGGESVEVTVAAAGTGPEGQVTGPAATASVAGRAVVHYEVERIGPPWRRELLIRLSARRPARIAALKLVRRTGRVMPQRPEDGETIGSWTHVMVPGEISVPAPAGSGAYWLRCFSDDDVIELDDPPVRHLQMKR